MDGKIDTGDILVASVTVDFPAIRTGGETPRGSVLVRRYLDVVNLATRNCLLFRAPLLSTSSFSRPEQTKEEKKIGRRKEEESGEKEGKLGKCSLLTTRAIVFIQL